MVAAGTPSTAQTTPPPPSTTAATNPFSFLLPFGGFGGTAPTTPTTTAPTPAAPASPPSTTATNPSQRGPDPTLASIQTSSGAFATSSATVPAGNGFGGGTIYYPTDTSQGTFGGVVITPGFTATSGLYTWLAQRLASQGFVTFAIDTNSTTDLPSSRATEMGAALTYLTQQSAVKDRVDPNRLAVVGHSMGGGGALEEAQKTPSLKAAVALQPWDTTGGYPTDSVPTMIIGAQSDTTAPPSSYSTPFYNSIPASTKKAYVEIAGASHFVSVSPNTPLAQYTLVWLKRYVDNDTRYSQFLCPVPSDSALSAIQVTCPV